MVISEYEYTEKWKKYGTEVYNKWECDQLEQVKNDNLLFDFDMKFIPNVKSQIKVKVFRKMVSFVNKSKSAEITVTKLKDEWFLVDYNSTGRFLSVEREYYFIFDQVDELIEFLEKI